MSRLWEVFGFTLLAAVAVTVFWVVTATIRADGRIAFCYIEVEREYKPGTTEHTTALPQN